MTFILKSESGLKGRVLEENFEDMADEIDTHWQFKCDTPLHHELKMARPRLLLMPSQYLHVLRKLNVSENMECIELGPLLRAATGSFYTH